MSNDESPVPRLLILETSGRIGRVAIARGSQILDERALDETRRHARDLTPAAVAMCQTVGWRLRELDGVAVSLGPGSYTGLRVGIITAKTLAWAIGCAAMGIETFAAIARQAPPDARELDVLADAQQQNLYVQRWTHSASGWIAETMRICPAAEWLESLRPGTWVTGPGLKPHESRVPSGNPIVMPADRDPRPASLLELALERWRQGRKDNALALEPLYLRPSNAEENWTRMGK